MRYIAYAFADQDCSAMSWLYIANISVPIIVADNVDLPPFCPAGPMMCSSGKCAKKTGQQAAISAGSSGGRSMSASAVGNQAISGSLEHPSVHGLVCTN